MHAVFLHQRPDRVVIALRLNPHQLRQQHAHALPHLLVIRDPHISLAVALKLFNRSRYLRRNIVRNHLPVAFMVLLNGVATRNAPQLSERDHRRIVVHRFRHFLLIRNQPQLLQLRIPHVP